jgi:ubiquinone/menaquinone biosynthesis C-methylase UbiE
VTRTRFGSAGAFSRTASDYVITMVPALAPVAAEVVRRADLQPGETVLDIGTGTGTGARLALGAGRRVIGLDAAAGMLEIARAEVPEAEFIEADFTHMPLEDRAVDVAIAVHALLFASDRGAALTEWRRVTRPGGRLSLSVPGPADAVPASVFGEIYDRYEVEWHPDDFPALDELATWGREAGWADVATDADPTMAITLVDAEGFDAWLRFGFMASDWASDRLQAFKAELMAAAPRGSDGTYRIPFGALYLTARRDDA